MHSRTDVCWAVYLPLLGIVQLPVTSRPVKEVAAGSYDDLNNTKQEASP